MVNGIQFFTACAYYFRIKANEQSKGMQVMHCFNHFSACNAICLSEVV